MNQNSPKNDEAPASIPQTTPASIGYGHPEYHFVQSVLEMQKTLGEINASIKALERTVDNNKESLEKAAENNRVTLEKSIDSLKSKVDDLVKWKAMIFGGAITIGFLIGLAATAYKLFDHSEVAPLPATQALPIQPEPTNASSKKPH